MTNFLNFPQLILICVYSKFQEKEASKGLIGEEWGGKFGGLGQDLNPRLKIWMENVKKNFWESVGFDLRTLGLQNQSSTSELQRSLYKKASC